MIEEVSQDFNEEVIPAPLPADSDPVDLENPVENAAENPKEKSRKKTATKRVSVKQKELMANFIIDNPELITHSSTKENEIELWNDLHQQLNDLKPEKSLDSWRSFFSRWRSQLLTKSEITMTAIDYKLKQFLSKIITNDQLFNSQSSLKRSSAPKQTNSYILEKISEVEKERSNLRLEVDNYELRVHKYKYIVHALENEIELKQARIKKLSEKKIYLNKKRRLLQKKDDYVDDPPEIEEKIDNENEKSQEQVEA